MSDVGGAMDDEAEKPRWLQGIRGDHARRLIESQSTVVKVVAGPGAGKTTCLQKRIVRLVDERGVARNDIFVGTFTRVIRNALRDALANPTPGSEAGEPGPVVATLHSHAAQLLREYKHAIAGRNFRFLLEHESTVMLYDIASDVPDFGSRDAREDELRNLQAQWARRRTLADARFAGAVDRWLRAHGGMLVGEVVPIATNALQAGDIDPKRFEHVFIDEYQDLTECEQAFVDLLVADGGSVVVLGDDDQSI
jgi:DNA helicase-2/ATP-dependent DNA helicase PcrA